MSAKRLTAVYNYHLLNNRGSRYGLSPINRVSLLPTSGKPVRELAKDIGLVALLGVGVLVSACVSSTQSPKPTLTTPELVAVSLFFPKIVENDVTFVPVQRLVPRLPSIAEATLKELLKGPTAEERALGLAYPIPIGTKLKSLKIRGGIAYADFDKQMEYQMGGSLRVMTIRQMILRTLKQFPDVRDVVISVEGRTEDILQP